MTEVFVATRRFGYGGRDRLPGEVFPRANLMHDDKLKRLEYVREVPDRQYPHCDACGRDFLTESQYDAHLSLHPTLNPPDPPRVTKMEDVYGEGMVEEMGTGRRRAGRAG